MSCAPDAKKTIILAANDVIAAPPALIRAAGIEWLPTATKAAGTDTSERFARDGMDKVLT